jgi:hypothetical protein
MDRCAQVQLENRELGVLVAGHKAFPFWRRNSSASKNVNPARVTEGDIAVVHSQGTSRGIERDAR